MEHDFSDVRYKYECERLLSMDYFERMARRLANSEPYVPGRLGSKKLVRSFADLIGVNTPDIYFTGTLTDIPWDTLPAEFVLKPAFASTSIGVMLLRGTEGGKYEDLLKGDIYTRPDLLRLCGEISKKYFDDPIKGEYILEELLRDAEGNTPPQDIRFYAFQGEIGMILKEDHMTSKTAQAMYFDGDFLPFSDVHSRYGVSPGVTHLEAIVDAKTPENWRALLAVAKRISVAVPTAFCRIDLYDTPKGVQLGEITFYPGTFYYKNRKLMSQGEADRLGRLWENAARRLAGTKSSHALAQAFTSGPVG